MQFYTTQTIEATSWMSTITSKDVTRCLHYVEKVIKELRSTTRLDIGVRKACVDDCSVCCLFCPLLMQCM